MAAQRPGPGVEYAAFPSGEYRAHASHEAISSLARAWNISESRAAGLLTDPRAYAVEARGHMTARQALRETERRYRAPHG